MSDTFVCMCKCCKAVSKEIHKGLLSMLLRNLEATAPAAYLLLCQYPAECCLCAQCLLPNLELLQ